MEKRALLVGVNDYRGVGQAGDLEAPEHEADQWSRLLTTRYKFPTPVVLKGSSATKPDVIREFRKLVSGLKTNDAMILFYAAVHGQIVQSHKRGRYEYEEALIVCPEEGAKDLKGAEITGSDLAAILKEAEVPQGTLFMIIPSTCFAENLEIPIPAGAKRLGLPGPIVDLRNVREFGVFDGTDFVGERPIIIAVSGRDEEAIEVPVNGVQRMLFSYRAIDWLWKHKPTLHNLIYRDIVPLKRDYSQTPRITGNHDHDSEAFLHQGTPELLAGRDGTDSPVDWLNVRFQGMCCFADPLEASAPYRKRVLLPYDNRPDPLQKHLAFLEVAEEEVEYHNGDAPERYQHVPGGKFFLRWVLKERRIEFPNKDSTPQLTITGSFAAHLPGMKRIDPDYLDDHPAPTCFWPAPPISKVAAFVDLSVGILSSGPLETVYTIFQRRIYGEVTLTTRTPKFVNLLLPITDEEGVIDILAYDDSSKTTITLRKGALPLIGNMRDADIKEDPTYPDDPRETFLLYYYLSKDPVPDDAVLPKHGAVPVNGCSSTGWP